MDDLAAQAGVPKVTLYARTVSTESEGNFGLKLKIDREPIG